MTPPRREPNKVLLVDADGVLHPRDAHFAVDDVRIATHDELLSAGLFVHCELLAAVLQRHPAIGMVVHSSWRLTHSVPDLRELLGPLGDRVVGVTPLGLGREASILAYMRRRRLQLADVLVLDDQAELFTILRPRVVASDPSAGIASPRLRDALAAALMALDSSPRSRKRRTQADEFAELTAMLQSTDWAKQPKPIVRSSPSAPTSLLHALAVLEMLAEQNQHLCALEALLRGGADIATFELKGLPERRLFDLSVSMFDGFESKLTENARLRAVLSAYITPVR